MTTPDPTPIARRPYVAPAGDEPLDDIEQAFVRAMVSALLAEIHEEEAAAKTKPDDPIAKPVLPTRKRAECAP